MLRYLTIRVDEHEEGPSAMMRKSDRDERRGDRFGDRGDRFGVTATAEIVIAETVIAATGRGVTVDAARREDGER